MASPIQSLFSGVQLANAAGLLYTAPGGTWVQLLKLTCTNTDASVRVVTFHVVAAGGSATTSNKTTITQGILAGNSWNSPNEVGLVLNPGDKLYGFADTAAVVNVAASGALATG